MAREAQLSLRVEEGLKDALERAARRDGRKLASLAVKVLSDWAKTHSNYVEEPEKPKK